MSVAIDRQDGLSSSTAMKGPCRVASTANLTLEGLQTVNGVALSEGNRVLVRAQTDGRQNGIWVADSGLWRRSADFKRSDDVVQGTRVGVVQGTAYANTTWEVSTADPFYIDTDVITFTLTGTNISAGFTAVDDSVELAALAPTAGAAIVLAGGIAIWTLGNFTSKINNNNPLYVKQDGVSASVGAWVYQTFPTPPVIDRTRPLHYQDFYRWKGNDHNAAMLALFDAMFQAVPDLFRSHVDLEGARIFLEEPVAPTDGGDFLWTFSNGRFLASNTSWLGDYMLDFTGTDGRSSLKFVNCEFDGQEVAHWMKSDAAGIQISGCLFMDNLDDGEPGMNMLANAHINIQNNTRFSSPDKDINPNMRNRIALRCVQGDQKVYNSIFNYFKTGMIFEGFATMMGNVHVYQGTGDLLTGHSAGIKFTTGVAGAVITNMYLDKCFIELSNEDSPTTVQLGGLTASGVHTALATDDPGFAFYQARDYGGHTGECYVSRVTIENGEYRNANGLDINLTRLYNPAAFDPSLNEQIIVRGNNFSNCKPEFSEPTVRTAFTASTQHLVDFSALTPFNSNIWNVLSVVGRPTSGGGQPLDIGSINANNKTVRFDTATNWAGDITATASVNPIDADGVIVK